MNTLALPAAIVLTAASVGAMNVTAANELIYHYRPISSLIALTTLAAIGTFAGCQIGRWFARRVRRRHDSAQLEVRQPSHTGNLDENVAISAAAIATTLFAVAGAAGAALLATQERFRAGLATTILVPATLHPTTALLPAAAGLVFFHAAAAICCTIFASWSFAIRAHTREFRWFPLLLAAGLLLGALVTAMIPNHDLQLVLVALPAFVAATLISLIPRRGPAAALHGPPIPPAASTHREQDGVTIWLATAGWMLSLWNIPSDPPDRPVVTGIIVAGMAGVLAACVAQKLLAPARPLTLTTSWLIVALIYGLAMLPVEGIVQFVRMGLVAYGVATLMLSFIRHRLIRGLTPAGAMHRASAYFALGCLIPASLAWLPVFSGTRSRSDAIQSSPQVSRDSIAARFTSGIDKAVSLSIATATDIDAGGPRYEVIRFIGNVADVPRSIPTQERSDRTVRRAQTALLRGGRFLIDLPNPPLVRAAVEATRTGRIPSPAQLYYVRAQLEENRYDALVIGVDVPAFIKRAEQLGVRSTVILLRGTRHLEALCEASDEALLTPELRHWRR